MVTNNVLNIIPLFFSFIIKIALDAPIQLVESTIRWFMHCADLARLQVQGANGSLVALDSFMIPAVTALDAPSVGP